MKLRNILADLFRLSAPRPVFVTIGVPDVSDPRLPHGAATELALYNVAHIIRAKELSAPDPKATGEYVAYVEVQLHSGVIAKEPGTLLAFALKLQSTIDARGTR